MDPAPPASRAALIRRVTFDLIGLPPTPEEVDAFVTDTPPDAYEQAGRSAARLAALRRALGPALARPRPLRRDATATSSTSVRPDAWRYRDYVIRAFNDDKPYDRFVREQLAGDELIPTTPQALIATGFNLLGPDMTDSSRPGRSAGRTRSTT